MNALVRKEIRLLFPAWAVAMGLLAGAVFFTPIAALAPVLFVLFGAGAILMALLPFGQECSLGTLSSMLVQPIPRQRLWRAKVLVLAVAMASVLCVLLSSYFIRVGLTPPDDYILPAQEVALVCGLIALTAYAGGLWTTLLFRQIAAAVWFTLLLPPLILVLTFSFLHRLFHLDASTVTSVLLVLYAVAGILWARRQFLQAQDVQWTGGTIALPGLQSRGAATEILPKRQPVKALIWKEIQLHQSSFLIAGVLLIFHIAVLFVRAAQRGAKPEVAAEVLLEFWWVFWLALPLLVASASAGEERGIGTHQAQLCLPLRRRSQTAIKLGVALLLGVFLGGFLPALIETVGGLFGSGPGMSDFFQPGPISWPFFVVSCAVAAWITLITFHASTLARNTLQAVGIAIVAGVLLTAIILWAVKGSPSGSSGLQSLPLIVWVGGPVLLVTLIGLAYYNFQQLLPGWTEWLLNAFAVVLALLFAGVSTAAIYHRVWELAAPLEPQPGPAPLSGPIRPQILAVSGLFVLLPDGRLWVPEDHTGGPSGGTFLPGSNWVQVAGSYAGTAGLRQDGSLWKLSVGANLERIGNDSDWKAVTAANGFFVALKNNGSLWGWGNNQSGQLGAGPKIITGDPVQIGTDEDWTAVFASINSCTGVKQDGTVWKWGFLPVGPEGWPRWKHGTSPEPIQWPLHGSDWLQLESNGVWDVILRQNGTLWVAGALPRNLLGKSLKPGFREEPVQVGNSSNWAQVDEQHPVVVAIKAGNILYQRDMHPSSVPWIRAVWTPSRRSDWIAVTPYGWGGCLALAADGTLSLFGHPAGPPAGFSGLLAPSRKPFWSINLLADSRL